MVRRFYGSATAWVKYQRREWSEGSGSSLAERLRRERALEAALSSLPGVRVALPPCLVAIDGSIEQCPNID